MTIVANVGFISLYWRDYGFTSYNYVTCINIMSRQIFMVARGVMYDIRQSRVPRRPLIGAARQRFPRGQLVWAPSWRIELGRRFQSEQTCFVMLGDIENSLCKL